jgi:hypothetical protein
VNICVARYFGYACFMSIYWLGCYLTLGDKGVAEMYAIQLSPKGEHMPLG